MELNKPCRKGSTRISYSFSGSVSSKKEEKFVDGEAIFAVVCVLGMFGATAYHIAMQIKNGLQERHREPPKPTPAEQSEEIYGFNFYDVSHGIDSTVTIREHLETLQRLQTKIDLSRENLCGNYRVVQIQWHDDVQNRYLTYDFPVSYGENAALLEQLVCAEKQRLTTSLFSEIQKMSQYGEVKTVDKTERGAGERGEKKRE